MNAVVKQTSCVIVGGGPAGVILSFILARQGIPVTLLEAHHDFDRDYRGDTLHPSILEIMDELGLADRLLQLPHTKLHKLTTLTPDGPLEMGDFSHLKTKYPYIALMPQVQFLEFVIHEAKRFPSFRLVMGARVSELVEHNGTVAGVRYHGAGCLREIGAPLTVGSDGRYSIMRKLGGFQAIKAATPLDLLWFRLPRQPADLHGLMGRFGNGHVLIQLDRGEEWQCGYSIPKGSFPRLRTTGIEALRQDIISTAPEFADRVAVLQDWTQISLLSVEADYLRYWYKPGLLLIGDAAHVMSPVGGNGINYAIQDAVAAANILSSPLIEMNVAVDDLAKVQRRRERAVKTMQMAINVLHRMLPIALATNKRIYEPDPRRSSFGKSVSTGMMVLARPFVNAIFLPVIAFGISPVHVEENLRRMT